MIQNTEIKKIILYTGFCFGLSWILLAVFLLMGGRWFTDKSFFITIAYLCMPLAATLIILKIFFNGSFKEEVGVSFKWSRWFFFAWLIPVVLVFACIGVSLLFRGVSFDPDMAGYFEKMKEKMDPEEYRRAMENLKTLPFHPAVMILFTAVVVGLPVNILLTFGEEAGFRGFLYKQTEGMSFYTRSLLIGFLWGVWYFPLALMDYNYLDYPLLGAFMIISFCVLLNPLLLYVRIKSGSVIGAAVLHGNLYSFLQLPIFVTMGGSVLIVGIAGAAGLITLAVFNLLLLLFDRFLTGKPIIFRAPAGEA